MSPTVGNFVADLVEMAKATEELPHAMAEIERLRSELDAAQRHSQSLETNIVGYKADIESLHDTRRKLEAERDDAEYRFLELDDKFRGLAGLVTSAGKAVGLVDKPEPVAQPEPTPEPVQEQAKWSDEQHAWVKPSEYQPQPEMKPVLPEDHPQDQSVPDPTAHSTAGAGHSSETAPYAEAMPDASTLDDVGYHNEPERYTNSWYDWANRMDLRYDHNWPRRPDASQAAS